MRDAQKSEPTRRAGDGRLLRSSQPVNTNGPTERLMPIPSPDPGRPAPPAAPLRPRPEPGPPQARSGRRPLPALIRAQACGPAAQGGGRPRPRPRAHPPRGRSVPLGRRPSRSGSRQGRRGAARGGRGSGRPSAPGARSLWPPVCLALAVRLSELHVGQRAGAWSRPPSSAVWSRDWRAVAV